MDLLRRRLRYLVGLVGHRPLPHLKGGTTRWKFQGDGEYMVEYPGRRVKSLDRRRRLVDQWLAIPVVFQFLLSYSPYLCYLSFARYYLFVANIYLPHPNILILYHTNKK